MSKRHEITNGDVASFMEAGNSTFTVVSLKTGARFTYKVTAAKEARSGGPSHFVKVLTGADNETDYAYLGQIYPDGGPYMHGRKSAIDSGAPSAVAFSWLRKRVNEGKPLVGLVEVWHEGRCCRCGRKLTVPSSIESGVGPECAGKM